VICLYICIRKRKRCGNFIACDAGIDGFPVTLIKNPVYAPIANVTARIGKNRGKSLIDNNYYLYIIDKGDIIPGRKGMPPCGGNLIVDQWQ
jgi:hypothetical protein